MQKERNNSRRKEKQEEKQYLRKSQVAKGD